MATPDDEEDDVGSAFTGQKLGIGPTQSIMAPAPQSGGMGFLSDPADRAALLQIGLNMMQPMAFGQTTGGHIAQAIGSGGEAVSRGEAEDLKRQQAEAKLQIADERLRIAQQNADTRERKGLHGAVKGLTAYQQYRAGRDEAKDTAREAKEAKKDELARAQRIVDQADALQYSNPDHPSVKKYGGKTADEVADMLRGSGGGGGGKYGPPGTVLKQGGKTYVVPPGGGDPVEQ